jgi:hypothetical protein
MNPERRLHERIPAGNLEVTLRIAGRPGVQTRMQDISRGGVGLMHNCEDGLCTDAEITLPGGDRVRGRIARNSGGSLALVFLQEKASLMLIDQALALVRETTGRAAA